jgi:hypothetical protein
MLAVQQWLPEALDRESSFAPNLPQPRASRLLSEAYAPLPAYEAATPAQGSHILPCPVSERRAFLTTHAMEAWAA